MRTSEDITRILRANQPYLAAVYGVKKIGLFGSYARSEAVESSDVDLVVEFERPIGLQFVELANYLEDLLGEEVDLLTLEGLQSIRVPGIAENIEMTLAYV